MDNSPIDLSGLSEPAKALIEKVAEAVGGLAKPWQLRRVARAQADAAVIGAKAQIEIDDLQRRALQRFVTEEGMKQANIESITAQAIPLLDEKAASKDIDTDWIVHFFDRGRLISDEDMQKLWASLLAGQANAPGSFSKQTINTVADFERSDAELFQALCRFMWRGADGHLALIYDYKNEIYANLGITFNSLQHLEALGLLRFGADTSYFLHGQNETFRLAYFGKVFSLRTPNKSPPYSLDTGTVTLTRAGAELANVCIGEPVPDYIEHTLGMWRLRWIELSA